MSHKVNGDNQARDLYIQVTSDSILTPQLKMLGAGAYAEQRPVWGSTLVYELYQNSQNTDQHAVRYNSAFSLADRCRILFNGHTLNICGEKGYCTWDEWTTKLTQLFPVKDQCLPFYNNYE